MQRGGALELHIMVACLRWWDGCSLVAQRTGLDMSGFCIFAKFCMLRVHIPPFCKTITEFCIMWSVSATRCLWTKLFFLHKIMFRLKSQKALSLLSLYGPSLLALTLGPLGATFVLLHRSPHLLATYECFRFNKKATVIGGKKLFILHMCKNKEIQIYSLLNWIFHDCKAESSSIFPPP